MVMRIGTYGWCASYDPEEERMQDRWDEDEAAAFEGELGEIVYASRLIGSDPALVLHGGGNTSLKAPWTDVTGVDVETLYVKGSGWDLQTITAPGFTPLPLARLRALLDVEALTDPQMMAALSAARLDPEAPQPSVETLLHALLPHRAVLHSHADVIVNLTNLTDGEQVVRSVFGGRVVIVPYVMPGFDLAKTVARLWPREADRGTEGMVLMNHGLFTFGDTAREAYRRHVELIDSAEAYLDQRAPLPELDGPALPQVDPGELAELRLRVSRLAGRPMILTRHTDPVVRWFVRRPDLTELTQRGPLTPDHIIRTKRTPAVGTDVETYAEAYRAYYRHNRHRARTEVTMLDPAPRVILDRQLGMVTVGPTVRDADIAADIYRHTMPVLARAELLGGYRALSEGDLFEVEYWDLEQAKLRRAGSPPELAGRVGMVTGAASGIGRACVAELLRRGAAVVGIDRERAVTEAFDDPAFLGCIADVTDLEAVEDALRAGVERFGGLDLLVVAAGVFGASAPIAELDEDGWEQVVKVNVSSVAWLLKRVHPLLSRAPAGGRVVVIGSKNVPAPGRGAAAYSASKAALTQLARVAALEWATDGIRVNVVHPDGVFDTGLWTEELLAARAARYGMTVEEYKRRNLLGVEVTSEGVARVVAELCGEAFAATTGAQIPVDGGNERVV